MTTIKIGNKTLTIADGCEVEITDEAITVKPAAQVAQAQPAIQYVPVYPYQTYPAYQPGIGTYPSSNPPHWGETVCGGGNGSFTIGTQPFATGLSYAQPPGGTPN